MGWRKRKPSTTWTAITKPAGFTWAAPITIETNGQGQYRTSLDVTTYQWVGAGKTYYVDGVNGNNTNDGLTPATALKALGNAIAKPDVDIILMTPGLYPRNQSAAGTTITRSMSIKVNGNGSVILGRHDLLTWTLAAGQSRTYQATRSGVESVYDTSLPNGFGDYRKLTKKTAIAEVEAEAGTWCQVGSIVYVRTHDDRTPDDNLRVNVIANTTFSGNITVYMEGIEVHGGLQVKNALSTDLTKFYAKDCKFKYCEADNGLKILGVETILVNCEAAQNIQDGFNYHISNTVICKSIEVNCVGRHNGIDGNDNGSTTHDGNKIVRLNGVYFSNNGPNVADVSNNTESWIVGCYALNSTYTGNPQNYTFASDGVSQNAWMEGCYASGSTLALSVAAATTVNTKNNKLEGNTQNLGTLTPY